MDDKQKMFVIEIWKNVVQVQQHFNDISMRIRSMFITILLALFASIGFLLDKSLKLEVGPYNVLFATLVPLFGLLGTYLFYFIDRYWYHRLLTGSVKHAITIEKKYAAALPDLSLSVAIGDESPYAPTGPTLWVAHLVVGDEKFLKERKLHSNGKIEFFYKSVMLALLIVAGMLAWFGGITVDEKRRVVAPASTTAPAPAPAELHTPSKAPPADKPPAKTRPEKQ